jgi:cellulose synthase/poly-beta-1,6-N-acetylglucosamine synthase-like glycosyltransferase
MVQIVTWVLAIYGLVQLIVNVINIVPYLSQYGNGMYIVIAVKNQQDIIEGFIRSIIFKAIYSRQEKNLSNIIVADLGSTDDTIKILKNLQKEYEFLRITNWRECEELIDDLAHS